MWPNHSPPLATNEQAWSIPAPPAPGPMNVSRSSALREPPCSPRPPWTRFRRWMTTRHLAAGPGAGRTRYPGSHRPKGFAAPRYPRAGLGDFHLHRTINERPPFDRAQGSRRAPRPRPHGHQLAAEPRERFRSSCNDQKDGPAWCTAGPEAAYHMPAPNHRFQII